MTTDKDREEAEKVIAAYKNCPIEYCSFSLNNLEYATKEIARIRQEAKAEAFESGYIQGHNDTVESRVRDSRLAALEYATDPSYHLPDVKNVIEITQKRGLKETVDGIRERWGADFDKIDNQNKGE